MKKSLLHNYRSILPIQEWNTHNYIKNSALCANTMKIMNYKL